MRRRDFIGGLGAVASPIAWPLAARAQQRSTPAIGYLYSGVPESAVSPLAAFRKGLGELGFVEGRNITIEYRYAQGRYERLPDLAADLVRRRVAVIATFGTGAAAAAKAATASIPIVFSIGEDPVRDGLVTSLNRPGGNITGVTSLNNELAAKRLSLVHDLLPRAERFAVRVDANDASAGPFVDAAQAAALARGWQLEVLRASTSDDIDIAFTKLLQMPADALLIAPSALLRDHRIQLVMLAVRHAVPTIYVEREFAEAGGLMSYGSSLAEQSRLAGALAGRILKGDKPVDLPVMQAVRIELVINLQTAKIIGLAIPPTLLAIADAFIE